MHMPSSGIDRDVFLIIFAILNRTQKLYLVLATYTELIGLESVL